MGDRGSVTKAGGFNPSVSLSVRIARKLFVAQLFAYGGTACKRSVSPKVGKSLSRGTADRVLGWLNC